MTKRTIFIAIYTSLAIAIVFAVWYIYGPLFSFSQPTFFWLLLVIPVLAVYEVFIANNRHAKLALSAYSQIPNQSPWQALSLIYLPYLLRILAIGALIFALARPQSQLSWRNVSTEGIDIMIAMDVSVSMLAKDFDPNRLESAKRVAIDFINERPNDRMGLVVYEGESFTQCPLTTDHTVLINLFKDIRSGMVEGGTAIGMGLANAVNRLRDSDAKSKVIILLTDGDNNAGSIAPITAAEIAQAYGIRVYTIGVGTVGKALSPVAIYPDGRYKYDYVDVKIDEESMEAIAAMTGGRYFRATDGVALGRIYQEIDQLEKTKINVTEHNQKAEEYFWFAVAACALFGIEFLLRETVLNTLS